NPTIKELLAVTGPIPPTRKFMGKLWKSFHGDRNLKEYHSYKYTPYLTVNPVFKDQLNCFTGFSLQHYRNTTVDITRTNIYKWLWVAWCNREEHKLNWMFNYFAHKLQKAHLKVKHMIVVYGTKTGTGKTTIRNFLTKLFDQAVFFVDSIKEFTGEFTGQQFGKLFCIIDDVEKWNKTASAKLKTRITSNTYTHRVMYSDPIEMDCYLDLICTSNSRTPVFIGPDDRRTELVVINEELKAYDALSTKFWTELYAEFNNNEIMGAFFEVFATRDISDVVFNERYRFSEQALAEQKKENMRSAFHFLRDYFTTNDCIFHRDIQYAHPKLFQFMVFKDTIQEGRHMVVTCKRLFQAFYTRWVKLTNQTNVLKERSFINDLKDLGVVGRYVVQKGGNAVTAVKISRKILEKAFNNHYNMKYFKIEDMVFETPVWMDLIKNEFPPFY
ncbi:MAG: primase-helicase family protein, partial [Candidatus Poribacteria bacterium]|nr:primase-helicase family protein [Candidatus Poribacteria bacterium]